MPIITLEENGRRPPTNAEKAQIRTGIGVNTIHRTLEAGAPVDSDPVAQSVGQFLTQDTATPGVYDWYQWNGVEWVFVRRDGVDLLTEEVVAEQLAAALPALILASGDPNATAYASRSLTLSSIPVAGSTFTITNTLGDAEVFYWRTTAVLPNEVAIASSLATRTNNLVAKINGLSQYVQATATDASAGTFSLDSNVRGVKGNNYAAVSDCLSGSPRSLEGGEGAELGAFHGQQLQVTSTGTWYRWDVNENEWSEDAGGGGGPGVLPAYDVGVVRMVFTPSMLSGGNQYSNDAAGFTLTAPSDHDGKPASFIFTFNTPEEPGAIMFDPSIQLPFGLSHEDGIELVAYRSYRVELYCAGFLWVLKDIHGPTFID